MEDFVDRLWRELSERIEAARRAAAIWQPTLAVPPVFAPAVALGGLLSLVLLSGLAIASVGLLLTTLLLAYLIADRVFGLSVELPNL